MKIPEWLKNLFTEHRKEIDYVENPPDEASVERIINKVINPKTKIYENKNSDNSQFPAQDAGADAPTSQNADLPDFKGPEKETVEKQPCCPYGVKRNIVNSIREIRKFEEEHKVAASVMKALLRIMAEIAVNAMKGKVSAGALLMLLNALNFDKAKASAYEEGELAGRNARIEEEYFPSADDGLPKFTGIKSSTTLRDDIFSIARDA